MHKMFIGGQWLEARDGATLPVINPADSPGHLRSGRPSRDD